MRIFFFAATAICFSLAVSAQEAYDTWEVQTEAGATLVLAPDLANNATFRDPAEAIYEVRLGGRIERVLQSGVMIGARGIFRAQRDHPSRPAGQGQISDTAMAVLPGLFTGLSITPESDETGPRGSLEAAYIYVDGGYGEVTLGRDAGVLSRFSEGSVSALSAARLSSPYLDPSGLNAIVTRPDVTGPSAKFSYVTPRILGVRLGASFTPELEARGLDRPALPEGVDLTNSIELGLNASRRLRESGLRFRLGAGYGRSDIDATGDAALAYGTQAETWFFGGEIDYESVRIGANWLGADEGRLGDDTYSAWSVGVAREWDDWNVSVTYGAGDVGIGGLGSDGISVAVSRRIVDWASAAVAYQDISLPAGSLSEKALSSQGIVVEITLDFEN